MDAATGEPTVYYRFGGRVVAWRNSTTLRYLLADHLSSSHAEATEAGADSAQRRYTPFGSDRTVAGAADLTTDHRYTGQHRLDAGNGNSGRELYHYGARAYLPGVGIFTQPDSIVPDAKNPQALNRYSYVYNNPLRFTDPSGNAPTGWDPDWVTRFNAEHPNQKNGPTEQDWQDYQFSLKHSGSGPNGTWTSQDWEAYGAVRDVLGDLLAEVGHPGKTGVNAYSILGILGAAGGMSGRAGPDGTWIVVGDNLGIPSVAGGITYGETILVRPSRDTRTTLIHEYVHVLQYRRYGISYWKVYVMEGLADWDHNAFEQQAIKIERIYEQNPWLPPPWVYPWAPQP